MSTEPRTSVIIVDDEPLARLRIRTLLDDEPDLEIVGEAGGGNAAVRLISDLRPDLVFLDVQMPGLDGFEVLRALTPGHLPLVIFVTAFDAHAIRAFEVAAVDYLLKPVEEPRFRAAVRRAIERTRQKPGEQVARRLSALLEQLPPTAAPLPPPRIPVRANGAVNFVRVQDIDWVDVVGNQVRLHVGRETFLLRETMSQFETRLPSTRFARIHRSTIVNLDRVKQVQPWFKGDYVLILHDGTRLMSGRTYRERVQQLLK